MKKALLLAGAMVVAVPAWAEWELTSRGEDQDWYIDHSTIRVNGNVRRVWSMFSREQPNKYGNRSAKMLDEYDCKEGRTRVIQLNSYKGTMGAGESESLPGPGPWEYIVPGTVGNTLMRAVCSK